MNYLTEKYEKRFKEEITPEIENFLKNIENTIQNIFPISYVNAEYDEKFGKSISIHFTLAGSEKETINNIIENDVAKHTFFIWGRNNRIFDLDMLELELSRGGSILINPEEKRFAYSKIKVPFRKVKGDSDKILKGLERYFKRLKDTIDENEDQIPERHKELLNYFK